MKRDDILDIIDRKLLLNKLTTWRLIAVFCLLFLIINLLFSNVIKLPSEPVIAQINIKGFIDDDDFRSKKLLEIADNKNIHALIVRIDSQGGSFVGGERLFNNLRKISENKPTVAILGNIAASAAYLTAIGTDYIIASQGTITGSVGVLLQTAELTDLASKLGIKPLLIKSNKYKAAPHFAEKITIEQKQYLQNIINESNEIFYGLVVNRRANLTEETKKEVKLGKIFLGKTAAKMNLIDELGDLESAKSWLKSKNININKIVEINLEENDNTIKSLLKGFFVPNINHSLKLLAI